MKNFVLSLVFMLLGGFVFAQSSCACATSSGTAQANCKKGSECSCSSRDGACMCGCSSASPEILISSEIASNGNAKIQNCGVLNSDFFEKQMNLKVEKVVTREDLDKVSSFVEFTKRTL